MTNPRTLIRNLLLVLALLPAAGSAATEPAAAAIAGIEQSLSLLQQSLQQAGQHSGTLQKLAEQANGLDAELQQCVRSQEQQLLKLEADLQGLGAAQPGEAQLVREERVRLEREVTDSRNRLASCRVLQEQLAAASSQIQERRRSLIRQRFFVRGSDILNLATRNLLEPTAWLDYAHGLLAQVMQVLQLGRWLLLLGGLVAGAMLPGFLLRRLIARWGSTRTDNDFTSVLIQSGKLGLAGHAPYLLAALAAAAFFFLAPHGVSGLQFWSHLSYGLCALLLFNLGIRALLLPGGQLPAPTFLPQALAQDLVRCLQTLGLLGLAGMLYFSSQDSVQLPLQARLFGRSLLLSLLVLNLLWFVWLIGRLPALPRSGRQLRRLLATALVLALAAEWLGYRALSSYLLRGLVGSLVLGGLTWMLLRTLNELFSGLERGKYAWQRGLRQLLELPDDAAFPGSSTLRFITVLGIWTGAALLLFKVWGVPETVFQRLYLGFDSGFDVAGLHITPRRILIGLILFVLVVQLTARLRERMQQRWLPRSRMDRGAREASATVFGYAGFLLAILIGLSAAGLDLSKLALIAGALSVGIGFGLQNIVSNFISGLILLFERPIGPGDYVSVGNTEGFVRRISIRSTEIETPERRSVIVPNSELISSQVTNWMRHDTYGRVKLEIGVAYGSDLRRVQQILLDIVRNHADVLQDGIHAPGVLLSGYGDSAVNFQIVVVVRNFAQRGSVASDINFAIDEAFRREGIEIPYPQRVVRLLPPAS